MSLPSKKSPPPPRQPGTHTNAEVKEALHARALRRTIVITAVVVLLLAALAIVSSTAQEYQGSDDAKRSPKAIVLVAGGLTPYAWDRSILSNKAPFTRLLNNSGGIYTKLSTAYDDAGSGTQVANATKLVRLLTGSTAADVKPTLQGSTSFLRTLKDKFRPIVVAPASYWSSNQMDNVDNACTRVGFFDAECTGTSCPTTDKAAYCNAFRKYVSCDNAAELYTDDIIKAFQETLQLGASLLYVQLSGFLEEESRENTVGNTLQKRSDVNLLDGTVGRIALALAERTEALRENWLVIVTSEGANAQQLAPLLMVVYSGGQIVQLKRPTAEAQFMTTDLRDTLFRWFDVEKGSINDKRVIGLCSDGLSVANCNTTNTAAAT